MINIYSHNFIKNISRIILLLILTTHTAYSRDLSIDRKQLETMPVDIKADKLLQDNKNNLYIAEGNAELHQGTRTLTADYIEFNLDTQLAKAKGNVKLQQGGDIIQCEAFEINFDTQVGEAHNANIFLKQENYHIKGKQIEKISENKYKVLNGTITTCDGSNPVWSIEAKKMNLTVEGYAHLKNSFFKIKGLPVLYVPYFIFPVKNKRATGLLIPEYGTSSSDGYEFNNSLFWAISENSDATYWLDYATKKGTGNGLEYRIRFKENSWAKLYGYYINEDNKYFDEEYSETKDRSHKRIYLNFAGEHYFTNDLYLKANANYISDREFYGDYNEQVRRSLKKYNKSSLRSKDFDESFLFLNKNWDTYNLIFNIDVYKNLLSSDDDTTLLSSDEDTTLHRLPQLLFSSMRQELVDTPLFYQIDASYDNLWRESGLKGHRITVFPKISLPKNFNGWLKFNPEIGFKGISYLDLNNNRNFDKEGIFPSIKAELSTNFIKIFNFENKNIKKIKHTIEPGLLYEYQLENDQEEIPHFDTSNFDIQDRFYKRNVLSYYVKNRFTALYTDMTNTLAEKEIGYIMLGQSVNFSEPKGGLYYKEDKIYYKGDPDEDFSDIFGEVRLSLLTALYFKSKAVYDPYNNNLRYYSALLNWRNNTKEYLKLEYQYAINSYETVDIQGKLKIYKPLYVFFDARYDMLENDDMDTEFGIDLEFGCWGTRISIENSSGSSGRKSDTSVHFFLYLIGLGMNTQYLNRN